MTVACGLPQGAGSTGVVTSRAYERRIQGTTTLAPMRQDAAAFRAGAHRRGDKANADEARGLVLTAGLALARFTLGGSGLDLTTRPADLW